MSSIYPRRIMRSQDICARRRDHSHEHDHSTRRSQRISADEPPYRMQPAPDRAEDRSHSKRTRGSKRAYNRSTARFEHTTTMAMNMTRFCTIG